MDHNRKNKLLLIGWDAADWKFLSPLMDEGIMPNLKKLVEGGVKGKLATLDPPLSPTLWTSIATGKRPYKHGIHGFTEPDPSGKGIRPINNTNRKVKAIWNILTQNNLKSNIVGWWPSHPAEPINGTMVSNFYQNAGIPLGQPWLMPKGTVHPQELTETLSKLRVHPEELTEAHVLPFVPEAHNINQDADKRLVTLNKITADCSSIQSAATYLMENTEWDMTAVYFDAIDHYCHAFMRFHPPYRDHIDRKEYELYKNVVKGGCIYHDMMLGRLLELIDDKTTVMLISDHGFHPDHNRPKSIPNEPSGPAIEHSPYGIIVVNGPNIKKDELIFGSSLLDITPTILSIFNLPVASDMDGKVLLQLFQEPPLLNKIESWENIPGFDGTHQNNIEQTDEEIQGELQQLIDLGYIDDHGENIEQAIKKTENENNFYLARSYFNGGEWKSGISLLEELHNQEPSVIRYSNYLLQGYLSTGQYKEARKSLDAIRLHSFYDSPQLDILEGTLLIAEKRFRLALKKFKKAELEAGELPGLQLRIATTYIQLNKLEKAKELIISSLKNDPENVNAYYSLGLCHYKNMAYEQAANAFLDAIGLMYFFPAAHFYLGESLIGLQKYEEAVQAFDTCLRLVPGMNKARQKIISIYKQFLKQPGKATKYKIGFENMIKGEITIVSGLPRSGTSMMMQMLEKGGLEIFTDKERLADENNPKGYYEHESVKNLAKNKKWLQHANGKTVKVIAQLLPHLPMNYKYKIIFMERDLLEVIQSQQKMLTRNGKRISEDLLPLNLLQSYKETVIKVKEWASNQANVEIHFVSYSTVVENPFLEAININEFFDGILTPEKMVTAVDQNLYREKVKPLLV